MVVIATFILVPFGGLVAVGWAKLANLGPLLVSVWFVERKVLRYVGWNRIFLPFLTILASFGLATSLVVGWGDPAFAKCSAARNCQHSRIGPCVPSNYQSVPRHEIGIRSDSVNMDFLYFRGEIF